MFTSVQKTHFLSQDLVVQIKYMVPDMKHDMLGDRVGLYKMPRTDPHNHVAYAWIEDMGGNVTIRKSDLPGEEGEYQLQYIRADFKVLGISDTFDLRRDVAVLKSIPVHEKNVENISEVFLENSYVEKVEVGYWKALSEEQRLKIDCLKISEEVWSNLLTKEKKASGNVSEENIKLRESLCDTETNLKETNEKLRVLIIQEDSLRQEVACLKNENEVVNTTLNDVRQELEETKTKMKSEDPSSFKEKMEDILVDLEVHKKLLQECTKHVEDLKEENKELTDKNAEVMLKLKELEKMSESMIETVTVLENDNLDLEQQLSGENDTLATITTKDIGGTSVGTEFANSVTAPLPDEHECPLCGIIFPDTKIAEWQNHVEQHDIANMIQCPICDQLFDKEASQEHQKHVEAHLQLQDYEREQMSLAESGWDLGLE